MATGLTTLAFVLERKDGTYERNLVNGGCLLHLLSEQPSHLLIFMSGQPTGQTFRTTLISADIYVRSIYRTNF